MTEYQEQVLEALYRAAGDKYNISVNAREAQLAINPRTIGALLKQGLIRVEGRRRYTVTAAGATKALDNRRRRAKFKVGDKVRWGKALGARTSTPIGGIFTVESVNDDGQYTLEFGHGAHSRAVPEAELEPVEEDADLKR